MSILKLFASTILASLVATSVLAHAVISEPAQFYPSANCNNKGPGNPYTDPNWRRGGASLVSLISADKLAQRSPAMLGVSVIDKNQG
jgi:hypothetical protein